ncbi:MAG: LacI family DNA-binding transcriptional regulator [Aggregatilineales bacterium]
MKNPNNSITIQEVAKEAGVSTATVSRVINKTGGVSDKLEKRVRDAMKDLNYHPSSLARNLKRQRSMVVGVMVPMLEHPTYGQMAAAIERKLFDAGYHALICSSEDDEERERAYLEMLLRQRVEGIIINSAARDTTHIRELADYGIPIILFDRILDGVAFNQVFCDNSMGGYIGIEHLIKLGHRRIGVVAAPSHPEPILRRIRGTQEALADYGIDLDPDLLITRDTQLFNAGYEAGRHLLQLDPRPTAIFALTDVTAVGVMHAAAEMNLRIPEDLSIVGYDNIPIASYILPPLTTVNQPIIEMGETAVDVLFKHIESPELEPEKTVLRTNLVVRQSTAAPSRRV